MMEFENNGSTSNFIRHLSHKRTSLNQKMNKLMNTTPKRMKGRRANVPPPLMLDPMTPPPTIQKQRILNTQYDFLTTNDSDTPIDNSPTLQVKHRQTGVSKSFLKNECCFCEEMLINKLNGERILELDCNHQCHYDCYLLLLNKDDKEEFPICCICDEKTKPIDQDLTEEMYSKTLVSDNQDQISMDLEPVPDLQKQSSTPYTPQNKIIDNCNSAGFQSSRKERYSYSASTLNSTPSQQQITIEDILKPTINIIPEFNKLSGLDTSEFINFGNVLNIFSTQFSKELDDNSAKELRELEIKTQINSQIIQNFESQIQDTKGLIFQSLSNKLRLFDFIEISLDGETWEFVQAFIFQEFLLLLNEEGDTIIGTIMINEHFTQLSRSNEHSLTLFFKTSTLPELHIRSLNAILVTKWVDFFMNKLHRDDSLTLIQITTNAWELVQDNVDIPDEIIQFNDMTARGLDLPFELMRSLLPKPAPLGVSLVMSISLINNSDKSDVEYLESLKKLIRAALEGLRSIDRFGLILIGRDGSRKQGHFGTFYGLVNNSWSGWDDILDELEVFSNYDMTFEEEMKISIRTCEKLLYTIPDLNFDELDVGGIRKFMIISGYDYGFTCDEGLFEKISGYNFTIEQIVISSGFDPSLLVMINGVQTLGNYCYNFHRFDDFDDVDVEKLLIEWKRIVIPQFKINLEIESEMKDIIQFNKVENHGFMTSNDSNEFKIMINDMDDGYYKNIKFDITINIQELQHRFKFNKGQFIEIPVLKYTSTYLGKTITSIFKTNLQLIHQEIPPETILSPLESTFGEYLDIPLLPPLSSFKDSIYIKRTIELMIIDTLLQDKDINEVISLIFGLIRGCSSNFISFYKDSKINKFKNFHDYINSLMIKLQTTNPIELIYNLKDDLMI